MQSARRAASNLPALQARFHARGASWMVLRRMSYVSCSLPPVRLLHRFFFLECSVGVDHLLPPRFASQTLLFKPTLAVVLVLPAVSFPTHVKSFPTNCTG